MNCSRFLTLFLHVALLTPAAFAAWPASADTNLVICDRTGEQADPKIVKTGDGGCYIAWYDWSSGNWDVYLLRLDHNGVPQWPHNGILISHQPQESWITDYDLAVDELDYAIVAFNDTRAGGDRDIYAYRVSPAGNMIWGDDGLTISDNGDFEPGPGVAVTTSGSIVIAWQQETDAGNVVNVRRVTPGGQDEWNPPTRTITSAYGVSIPRIVSDFGDGVIVEYLVHRGNQSWSPKHIFAQRFDVLGQPLWSDTGVVVSSAGGLGFAPNPEILPDGANGAYCYWYDSHDNSRLHVYAQHLQSDGSAAWTPNGVQTSLSASELQSEPAATFVGETGDLILFYMTANLDQSQWGLGGQAIRGGLRQWGDNGIAFLPLGQQQRINVRAVAHPEGAVCLFKEYVQGSALNSLVKAFRVETDGDLTWPQSPRTLCSVVSEKGDMNATVTHDARVIAGWPDKRSDPSGNIYLQNINEDGSLGGGSANQPPDPFSLISPLNNDSLPGDEVTLVWHAAADPDSDAVEYVVHFGWFYGQWNSSFIRAGADTTLSTTAQEIAEVTEHTAFSVEWWVEAFDESESSRSAETWSFTFPDIGGADDPPTVPRDHQLLAAFPNPFNPATSIRVSLASAEQVALTVFDLRGRFIMNLHDGLLTAGTHSFDFAAASLPAGVYFCRLQSASTTRTLKLLLLK